MIDIEKYKKLLKTLKSSQRSLKYIKTRYRELYDYVMGLGGEISWSEKLYWFENDIVAHPVCCVCGKPTKFGHDRGSLGYRKYCSMLCSNSDVEKINSVKQTNIERYGVPCFLQTNQCREKSRELCLKIYGVDGFSKSNYIKDKVKKTNLERYGGTGFASKPLNERVKKTMKKRYGVEYTLQSDGLKNKIKQTNLERYGVEHYINPEKIKQTNLERYGGTGFASVELAEKTKQTNLERYGVEHYINLEKIKQTNLKRYGVDNYTKTEEYKKMMEAKQTQRVQKVYETKKAHGTFNTSSIEQRFKKYLDEHNIDYKYQYKSENYPFVCDFYFPDKDLYLEIQGHWSHGGHPYNPDSKEDKKVVEMWRTKNTKFYKIAEEVWTIRDPQKRQWVKEHNLNWKEVFTYKLNELLRELQLSEDQGV